MRKLRHVLLGLLSAAAVLSAEANAATVNGTLKLTLTGTLRVAGTGYTTVDCKAYAVLIPTTDSSVTVSAAGLLSWLYSGDQSANAHAGFNYSTAGSSVTGTKPIQGSSAGSVTGFTCVISVPYTFTDAAGSGQSLAVMYEVQASDPGYLFPPTYNFPPTYPGGHTRQVQQIALPPANGTVTSLSAHLKL